MTGQTRAILWAQLRILLSYGRRAGLSAALSGGLSALWYGLWVALGILASRLMSDPGELNFAGRILSGALLLVVLYWQVVPVLMASTGFSVDTRRLLVYPIPHRQLFGIDLALRGLTALEMLIVLCGTAIGLWLNPQIPVWGPLALIPFIALNLFVAPGVRELLTRLLARRRIREAVIFIVVLVAALPQVLATTHAERRLRQLISAVTIPLWPWTAFASLAQGKRIALSAAIALAWTAAAFLFGRIQFERGLRFDASAAGATSERASAVTESRYQRLFYWPSAIFRDPLAALVEKEIRYLSRTPRFRLVFLMGFSFGLLIWIPIATPHDGDTFLARNYLALVSVYALLLLGDVCFWNCFGFDRGAAEVYYTAPVRFRTVLLAKNIASLFFVLLELSAIAMVCGLFRMPLGPSRIIEAFLVALVLSLYLLAFGNISSTYNPRPVNPLKSTRSGSSGKVQALLFLVYPVAVIPAGLAYLARWALDSEAAFYGALAIAAGIGACLYWAAMDSAASASGARREQFLAALSQGEGPIG